MAIYTDSVGGVAKVSGHDDSKEQNAVVRKWISMVQRRLKLNAAILTHGKNQSRLHQNRLDARTSRVL